MKNKLHISGFKCFQNAELELNNISILVGANGAGKSSIIQAVLLLTQAIGNSKGNEVKIPINDVMGLDLGKVDNIFYDGGFFNNNILNEIKIAIDDFSVEMRLGIDFPDEHTIKAQIQSLPFKQFPLGNKVHFLDAERLGPRYVFEFKGDDIDSCGIHGEHTAYIWEKHSNDKLKDGKRLTPDKEGNFSMQLTDWIGFIFDNTSIQVKKIYDRALQIQVTNHSVETTMLSVGFGLSYALPILVEGLLLNDGECLIVENPEAHLQPKAQIRLGYFLAVMAASGVKIIIETHSEHIIQGIIKATTDTSINFSENDIAIYYVDHKSKDNITPIGIDDAANNNYPKGFFDTDTSILDNTITQRKATIKI